MTPVITSFTRKTYAICCLTPTAMAAPLTVASPAGLAGCVACGLQLDPASSLALASAEEAPLMPPSAAGKSHLQDTRTILSLSCHMYVVKSGQHGTHRHAIPSV